jgi:hypothetical protein
VRTWSEANNARTQWACQWESIHFDVMQPKPMGTWLYDYNSRVQMCSYSLPREMSPTPGAPGGTIRWEDWATAHGLDIEKGYIHHGGVRKTFLSEGVNFVYPANMGDSDWREFAVSEMMIVHKQQESPCLYHGQGAGNRPYDCFPLFIYDLAFYYIPADSAWYDIYNSDEYNGQTLDENHPYVKGHYDLLVEFQAALAADPDTEGTGVIPNYGSTSMLYNDPIITAQLGIVQHAQTQVFATNETLDKTLFDKNMGKVATAAAAGITTYSNYSDLALAPDYAPTPEGLKLSNALFHIIRVGDYVPARYVATPYGGRPPDAGYDPWDWEFNPMFRSGYLGQPTGDVEMSGPGNRLYSREYENGIVYIWLKQAATDPPDEIEITVPDGAKEMNEEGNLVDIAVGAHVLTSNEGITIITNPAELNEATLITGIDREEWPREFPGDDPHNEYVDEGTANYDDSDYIESHIEDVEDRFTFLFPSNIGRLVEYKLRIRYKGIELIPFGGYPGIRAVFWANGNAWRVAEFALVGGFKLGEIHFNGLDLSGDDLKGGGAVSLIVFPATDLDTQPPDPWEEA